MNQQLRYLLLICTLIISGCASTGGQGYALAPLGAVPEQILQQDIASTSSFATLQNTYGSGLPYERAKINYLISRTRSSGFSFDRNGHIFDAQYTAKHISKKYRQRIREIQTAQDFIEKAASVSNASGRPYIVIVDGVGYRTNDVLKAELKAVETQMDQFQPSK